MKLSRTPNESALSEETDQPEKKFLPEIKRQVESTWIVKKKKLLLLRIQKSKSTKLTFYYKQNHKKYDLV